ncbi:AAA family ATPase [Nocardia sp. NPDC051570]|uniref:MinD/ParA family ATP-binding protein n=1 Tax=Nocardia sp. NPDC051570 TaxID=3364324 RepID=UPI0037A689B4
MSRNDDGLPMLPPWLSESEVTQVGYEAPVQNLPQEDLIPEESAARRRGRRKSEEPEGGRKRRIGWGRDKPRAEEIEESDPPNNEAREELPPLPHRQGGEFQLPHQNSPTRNNGGDQGGEGVIGSRADDRAPQSFSEESQDIPAQPNPPGPSPEYPAWQAPTPIPPAPTSAPDTEAAEPTTRMNRPELPPPPERTPNRPPLPDPPGPADRLAPGPTPQGLSPMRPPAAPVDPNPVAALADPSIGGPRPEPGADHRHPALETPVPTRPGPDDERTAFVRPPAQPGPHVPTSDGPHPATNGIDHRAPQSDPRIPQPGPQSDARIPQPGPQSDPRIPQPGPQSDPRIPQPGPQSDPRIPQPGLPPYPPHSGTGTPTTGFADPNTGPHAQRAPRSDVPPPGPRGFVAPQTPYSPQQGGQWQQPQWATPPPQQQYPPQYGPQGRPPSLDDVPMRRAKKSPGSGWRRAVHHMSGGAINPGMSAEERRLQELVARIRQPVRGDYRIAVLSLKGGVGKTTTTMGIGSIFASIRGDRVIAVDANPDFGTLSQRVPLQTRSTVRDLLLDQSIRSYSDVRRHTSQATSRLEVLASERDPAASEAFSEDEYRKVARLLQRFYNIILTDCGTGLMHSAMAGVLDLAHSLVLISSSAIDGARSAAATLDWLSLHGHDHLVRNAVVVINLPRPGSPNVGIQQLREYFLSRCRAVHIIPYDPHLSEGAEIDLTRLHKTTKRALVELAATVADDFATDHRPYTV